MKKNRMGILILIIIFIVLSISSISNAQDECVSVFVNGTKLSNKECSPVIHNDRTLIPVRMVFDFLDASVNWQGDEKIVEIDLDDTEVVMKIGENLVYVNNEKLLLDVPPMIINNRTMVPLRFISESFGAEVIWNSKYKSVYIFYEEKSEVKLDLNSVNIQDENVQTKDYNIIKSKSAEISGNEQEKLEKIIDSNVSILTYDGYDIENSNYKGLGSGVIISEGIIATNYHVVDEGKKFAISYSDNEKAVYHTSTVIFKDEETDIALILSPSTNRTPAQIGNSDELVEGEKLTVVGNPLGEVNTISLGSFLKMQDIGDNMYINIDNPVFQGNSGGGLYNEANELIGIVCAKGKDNNNSAYAVPINEVKELLANMKNNNVCANMNIKIFNEIHSFLYNGYEFRLEFNYEYESKEDNYEIKIIVDNNKKDGSKFDELMSEEGFCEAVVKHLEGILDLVEPDRYKTYEITLVSGEKQMNFKIVEGGLVEVSNTF